MRSAAFDVSANGEIVVGFASHEVFNGVAYYWDDAGIHRLDDPFDFDSLAYSISPSGNYIGGYIGEVDALDNDYFNAAVWDSNRNLTLLKDSSGNRVEGRVLDVSNHGYAVGETRDGRGFIWHPSFDGVHSSFNGAQIFDDWLTATPGGTTLSFASKGVEAIAEDTADGQLLFALSDYEAPGASAFVEVEVAGIAAAGNNAPVTGGAASASGSEDDGSINGSVPTASDADGDSLTYAVVGTAPAGVTFRSNGTFSVVPSGADQGLNVGQSRVIEFDYLANDGSADSAAATVTVTIDGVNDSPTVAHAIADQNTTDLTAFSFAFAGTTFADVDAGDSLTYSATKSDGSPLPSWLTFTAGTQTFSGTPPHSEVGTLSIKVIATDGSHASVSDTFNLVVAEGTHLPGLSINDVTVTEGTGGSVSAMFRVTLSAASTLPITVRYATANGTATAGSDFTTASGTLTFSPGQTSKTFTVMVTGDSLDEAQETFFVNLSVPTNALIFDAQGQGIITDNDNAPALSINNVTVTEGTGIPVNTVFTVKLSAKSGLPITVHYATANRTAVAPNDFDATSGTVTFAPRDLSKTITVPVAGDSLDEASETFLVNLSDASNASISVSQGQGTITDNDPKPSLSINDVTVTEGTGSVVEAEFTVRLFAVSGLPVSVKYATANSTAVAPADFAATSGQLLNFAPGETIKTFRIAVAGDARDELNETFFINLSAASNATIADSRGIGTILDDDATPTLSINDVTVTEGTGGAVNAIFTVTLSAASNLPVSVRCSTANDTALSSRDYTATSRLVTFAPGETTKTISISILGDSAKESSESLFVNLTNAFNALFADNQGLGTILDND